MRKHLIITTIFIMSCTVQNGNVNKTPEPVINKSPTVSSIPVNSETPTPSVSVSNKKELVSFEIYLQDGTKVYDTKADCDSRYELNFEQGENLQLKAKLIYSDGSTSENNVNWSIKYGNENVSISDTGKITGLKFGQSVIEVTSKDSDKLKPGILVNYYEKIKEQALDFCSGKTVTRQIYGRLTYLLDEKDINYAFDCRGNQTPYGQSGVGEYIKFRLPCKITDKNNLPAKNIRVRANIESFNSFSEDATDLNGTCLLPSIIPNEIIKIEIYNNASKEEITGFVPYPFEKCTFEYQLKN